MKLVDLEGGTSFSVQKEEGHHGKAECLQTSECETVQDLVTGKGSNHTLGPGRFGVDVCSCHIHNIKGTKQCLELVSGCIKFSSSP